MALVAMEIDTTTDDDDQKPLGERVIAAIESLPDRTIRPARLAALLGLSVNEACAELCGLMAAVGGGTDGASFTFAHVNSTPVMVFSFPPDFAARALKYRTRQERWRRLSDAARLTAKCLKIITAFGLILSLFILLVCAILGVGTVLVATSQNDRGGRGRALVLRQLHALLYTGRQLLWCWALFGPSAAEDDNHDPFLRETAYDLALLCSLCCGNPGSIFFWMRAQQWRERRRHRLYRGWGGQTSATNRWGNSDSNAYGIEGVTLLRGTERITNATDHRGVLSVAVEFLFGPTPFHPPHEVEDKWKLRSAVIVQTCTTKGGITLRQLAPYADQPPPTLRANSVIVQQGLIQVAHFNGMPKQANELPSEALFVFPELVSESATVMAYDPRPDDAYNGSFLDMLYSHPQTENGRRMTRPELASFWNEPYYHFTKLTSSQFMYCLFLGFLNAFGVFWLAQSLHPNGALGPLIQGTLRRFLVDGLVPVLSFYAQLFFVLPTFRLVWVWYLNIVRRQRNNLRQRLANELRATTATTL